MLTRFTRRLCSTTDVVPCVFCKHYDSNLSTCKNFFEFDKISGEKTYYYAKFIRSDDSKCGFVNPKLYEPVINDLLQKRSENRVVLNIYHTIAGLAGGSSCMLVVMTFFS